jgi:hypothetical protein
VTVAVTSAVALSILVSAEPDFFLARSSRA